nr:50S ribosomal protein L29 [Desulfobulbaceae bacterium]
MKTSEIRTLNETELDSKVNDLREDYFKLKFKHGIRQLEDTSKLNSLRKDIARIKTVINEKKLKA